MDQKEVQYSHEWIYKLETPSHWILYWNQLDMVLNKSEISKEQLIMEVGVGSGLTAEYLKRKGYNVKTIDIDENKSPDIVADITKYDLPNADMYIAFEIFEHIPIDKVFEVWTKLASKKVPELIFSVPYGHKTYLWAEIWLPIFGKKTINISRKRKRIQSKNHHWEIGINNISVSEIEKMLKQSGYIVTHSYRYRNHHFFLTQLSGSHEV